MWKKIHSNRNPKDTLYSELKKEFGSRFDIIGNKTRQAARARPKLWFSCMVTMMLISMIRSLVTWYDGQEPVPAAAPVHNPMPAEFNRLLQIPGAVRANLSLRKFVDSLAEKKQLTGADSAQMETALDSILKLHHQINHHENKF